MIQNFALPVGHMKKALLGKYPYKGLQRTLLMLNHTRPLAYLCRGYITELSDKQILEKRLAIEYEVE